MYTPLPIRSATPNADSPTNPNDVVIAVKNAKLKAAGGVVAEVDTEEVEVADTVVEDPNEKCTKPPVRLAARIRRYPSNPLKVAPFSAVIAFAPAAIRAAIPKIALVVSILGSLAYALPPELLDVIPRERLAYVALDQSGDADDSAPASSQPSVIAIGTDILHRFGGKNINQSAVSTTLDVLSTLTKLESYPFAVVVTDASARRLGADSFRLSNLQAAAIIHTRGHNGPITQHIQDLLTRWTSQDSARISRSELNDSKVFTLIDQNLPDWCVIKWGSVGDFYVVALGERGFNDAVQSIRRAGEHDGDATKIQQWQTILDSRSAHLELQINFDGIRRALSNVVRGRTQSVLDELGFADCSRSMWTVTNRNRAVVCTNLRIIDGKEVVTPISTEAVGVQTRLIPDAATEYTLFRCGLDDVLKRAASAYVASRRQEVRESMRLHWTAFETESGISLEQDLFNHLDDIILVHNDPPHPLRLPLLSTIVIPIVGDPAMVDRTLIALFKRSNRWLKNAFDNNDAKSFIPQFTRDHDNVWYLSFGFAGPAITVADHYIVISHSPLACRHARDFLQSSDTNQPKSIGK